MDFALHQVAERLVDPAVPDDRRKARERIGDDTDPEVPPTARRARVTDVKVAFIDDRELAGRKCGGEPLTEPALSLRGTQAAHGQPGSGAGFARAASQSTCGIRNTNVAIDSPKTLKFTQTASE